VEQPASDAHIIPTVAPPPGDEVQTPPAASATSDADSSPPPPSTAGDVSLTVEETDLAADDVVDLLGRSSLPPPGGPPDNPPPDDSSAQPPPLSPADWDEDDEFTQVMDVAVLTGDNRSNFISDADFDAAPHRDSVRPEEQSISPVGHLLRQSIDESLRQIGLTIPESYNISDEQRRAIVRLVVTGAWITEERLLRETIATVLALLDPSTYESVRELLVEKTGIEHLFNILLRELRSKKFDAADKLEKTRASVQARLSALNPPPLPASAGQRPPPPPSLASKVPLPRRGGRRGP